MTKQSTTDAIKKKAIQETVEATGDLIGNNIADKITKVSKTSPWNNFKKYLEEGINLQQNDRKLLMV